MLIFGALSADNNIEQVKPVADPVKLFSSFSDFLLLSFLVCYTQKKSLIVK